MYKLFWRALLLRTVHLFQNFYGNFKEYEESLNEKAILIKIYNQMWNLLYRRLVEVLEHFPERLKLEKSLEMEDCPSLWQNGSSSSKDVFFALNALNSIA